LAATRDARAFVWQTQEYRDNYSRQPHATRTGRTPSIRWSNRGAALLEVHK